MEKRYPRGMIYSKNGWSGLGEDIMLGDHGILYSDEGKINTIFVPYTSIDRIKYDTIPQHIIDKMKAAEDGSQKAG